jgi:starvation-inducible DNA-binding protein
MKQARTALADTFFMYQKAHSYHWNVEGIYFSQFHDFFGDLYQELFDAVDPFAEELRALGQYAPRNVEEMYDDKSIDCKNQATNAKEMVSDLLQTNQQVINSLNILFKELESKDEQGFMDFVASRIDKHKKHGWMLRSFLKDGE